LAAEGVQPGPDIGYFDDFAVFKVVQPFLNQGAIPRHAGVVGVEGPVGGRVEDDLRAVI